MTRRNITAPSASSIGPYSHAVDADGLIFLSGQTPIIPGTSQLIAGGIREQTRQCFENLFAVLAAGGLTPDEVQKVNVFLTDMANFQAMNEIYQQQFSEPFPARTTIGVAGLPLGALVEIEMIAKRP